MKSGLHLPKVIGDYRPGYAYWNVKIHKPGNLLRPIISQIPTPTYRLAKRLNSLLTPYVPCSFRLKSPKEFIDLLRGARATEIRAFLDVESLLTNVPVDETIRMMMYRVYRDPACIPLDIPESVLIKLLQECTKEAPFLSPDVHMYKQVSNVRRLQQLKEAFEQNSVLSFTYEIESDGTLPFLDVIVTERNGGFHTAVYTKETDIGMCLNANGDCPDRHKRSVVNAYVNRAHTHSCGWKQVDEELCRI
ncbi:uncharacterized protein [Procambarus clarkii]|uniref:uncharacterized protein n=1 Tax=Procambarus clarkii TaxID=6728 RepID=UPI00374218EA